jgi:hypothetical protein
MHHPAHPTRLPRPPKTTLSWHYYRYVREGSYTHHLRVGGGELLVVPSPTQVWKRSDSRVVPRRTHLKVAISRYTGHLPRPPPKRSWGWNRLKTPDWSACSGILCDFLHTKIDFLHTFAVSLNLLKLRCAENIFCTLNWIFAHIVLQLKNGFFSLNRASKNSQPSFEDLKTRVLILLPIGLKNFWENLVCRK